jgi:hypothetical protein
MASNPNLVTFRSPEYPEGCEGCEAEADDCASAKADENGP